MARRLMGTKWAPPLGVVNEKEKERKDKNKTKKEGNDDKQSDSIFEERGQLDYDGRKKRLYIRKR